MLPTIARELAGPPETAATISENLALLGAVQIEALAARYLASARETPAARPNWRFIDKMHGNFARPLACCNLMFPSAAIIDARRTSHGIRPLRVTQAAFQPRYELRVRPHGMGLYYRDYAGSHGSCPDQPCCRGGCIAFTMNVW